MQFPICETEGVVLTAEERSHLHIGTISSDRATCMVEDDEAGSPS